MSIKVYEGADGKVTCEIVGVRIRAKTTLQVREKAVKFLEAYSPYMELTRGDVPSKRNLIVTMCVSSSNVHAIRLRLEKLGSTSLLGGLSVEWGPVTSSICGGILTEDSLATIFYRLYRLTYRYPEVFGYVYVYDEVSTPVVGFEILHGKLTMNRSGPPSLPQIQSSSLPKFYEDLSDTSVVPQPTIGAGAGPMKKKSRSIFSFCC